MKPLIVRTAFLPLMVPTIPFSGVYDGPSGNTDAYYCSDRTYDDNCNIHWINSQLEFVS